MFLQTMTQYKTLDQDDVIHIVEDILEAKNESKFIAEKLKLPKHTIDEIHMKQNTKAQERLLEVIHEFVNRVEPRPTWGLIIEALRSPLINLPLLANNMERKHIPTPKTPSGIVLLLSTTFCKQHSYANLTMLFMFCGHTFSQHPLLTYQGLYESHELLVTHS